MNAQKFAYSALQRATRLQRCTVLQCCAATKTATQRNVCLRTRCSVAVLRGFDAPERAKNYGFKPGEPNTAGTRKILQKGPGMPKTIALNENGRRIGESHPRAKLLDHEVDQVLDLLDAGLSYAEVALKFDVSKSCIAHIATGRRRGQAVCRVLRVSV